MSSPNDWKLVEDDAPASPLAPTAASLAGKTCPKCGHVRQGHESTPDWQCPRCGVAYDKAVAPSPSAPSAPARARRAPSTNASPEAAAARTSRRSAPEERDSPRARPRSRRSQGPDKLLIVVALLATMLIGALGWRWWYTKNLKQERAEQAAAAQRQSQLKQAETNQADVDQIQQALKLLQSGQVDDAREIVRRFAEQGNPQAMLIMGLVAARWPRDKPDLPQAHDWFKKADQAGEVMALVWDGFLYEVMPSNDPSRYDLALRQYQLAARTGEPSGLYSLGQMHQKGLGTAPDLVKAYAYYALGAKSHRDGSRKSMMPPPPQHDGLASAAAMEGLKARLQPPDKARIEAQTEAWQPGQALPEGLH